MMAHGCLPPKVDLRLVQSVIDPPTDPPVLVLALPFQDQARRSILPDVYPYAPCIVKEKGHMAPES
jgi:hypothetical protein